MFLNFSSKNKFFKLCISNIFEICLLFFIIVILTLVFYFLPINFFNNSEITLENNLFHVIDPKINVKTSTARDLRCFFDETGLVWDSDSIFLNTMNAGNLVAPATDEPKMRSLLLALVKDVQIDSTVLHKAITPAFARFWFEFSKHSDEFLMNIVLSKSGYILLQTLLASNDFEGILKYINEAPILFDAKTFVLKNSHYLSKYDSDLSLVTLDSELVQNFAIMFTKLKVEAICEIMLKQRAIAPGGQLEALQKALLYLQYPEALSAFEHMLNEPCKILKDFTYFDFETVLSHIKTMAVKNNIISFSDIIDNPQIAEIRESILCDLSHCIANFAALDGVFPPKTLVNLALSDIDLDNFFILKEIKNPEQSWVMQQISPKFVEKAFPLFLGENPAKLYKFFFILTRYSLTIKDLSDINIFLISFEKFILEFSGLLDLAPESVNRIKKLFFIIKNDDSLKLYLYNMIQSYNNINLALEAKINILKKIWCLFVIPENHLSPELLHQFFNKTGEMSDSGKTFIQTDIKKRLNIENLDALLHLVATTKDIGHFNMNFDMLTIMSFDVYTSGHFYDLLVANKKLLNNIEQFQILLKETRGSI